MHSYKILKEIKKTLKIVIKPQRENQKKLQNNQKSIKKISIKVHICQ